MENKYRELVYDYINGKSIVDIMARIDGERYRSGHGIRFLQLFRDSASDIIKELRTQLRDRGTEPSGLAKTNNILRKEVEMYKARLEACENKSARGNDTERDIKNLAKISALEAKLEKANEINDKNQNIERQLEGLNALRERYNETLDELEQTKGLILKMLHEKYKTDEQRVDN